MYSDAVMTRTHTIIIGAGPIGLELAVALKLLGIDYVHLDASQIGHTISWFPRQMRFFSSPQRIAIAGVPLNTPYQEKASREQYLAYLRNIVDQFDLEVNTYERVTSIARQSDQFTVRSVCGGGERIYEAQNVVLAIGDLHRPRMLNIEGESLGHVSHYFDEPHPYFRKRLLIVGGKNSAVEAAIRCQNAGAKVAISYRRATFNTDHVKYWLTPEIEMLIKTGKITFYPGTVPAKISSRHVTLAPSGLVDGAVGGDVDADFVLLLVGYEMDYSLFERAGVKLSGENRRPQCDRDTMQTNVPGLFVAGTAAAGTQLRFHLFIENCHPHVDKIVRAITGKTPPFCASDQTHSGRYALPES